MNGVRQMISVPMEGGRFNFRAAGIVLREGHVLVHRATRDPYWTLPGGRVELGEASAAALAREIEEELGVPGRVGPLRFAMENFFSVNGEAFHELGHYYSVEVPGTFAFRPDGAICHRVIDGDADLEFKWILADEDALAGVVFHPARLRSRLGALPVHTEHIVAIEEPRQ